MTLSTTKLIPLSPNIKITVQVFMILYTVATVSYYVLGLLRVYAVIITEILSVISNGVSTFAIYMCEG